MVWFRWRHVDASMASVRAIPHLITPVSLKRMKHQLPHPALCRNSEEKKGCAAWVCLHTRLPLRVHKDLLWAPLWCGPAPRTALVLLQLHSGPDPEVMPPLMTPSMDMWIWGTYLTLMWFSWVISPCHKMLPVVMTLTQWMLTWIGVHLIPCFWLRRWVIVRPHRDVPPWLFLQDVASQLVWPHRGGDKPSLQSVHNWGSQQSIRWVSSFYWWFSSNGYTSTYNCVCGIEVQLGLAGPVT